MDVGSPKRSKSSSVQAQSLAHEILSLYDVEKYSDAVVSRIYHTNAEFHDPIVDVKGIENIKANLRAVGLLVKSSKAVLIRGALTGSVLTIESMITYHIRPFPALIQITMRIFTICETQNGKIQQHTDHWDITSLVQNVPVVSFFYNKLRSIVGALTSAVFKRVLPSKE